VPPSPPAEKTTARQHQTGQSSAGDGAGNGGDSAQGHTFQFPASTPRPVIKNALDKHFGRATPSWDQFPATNVEVLGDRVRCDVRYQELKLPPAQYQAFKRKCMGSL
jgi:hypothetical protein